MGEIRDRIKHAWNAFLNNDDTSREIARGGYSGSFGSRPDRPRMGVMNERSIVSSIYTRISIDVAAIALRHVRLDSHDRYLETVDSGLNRCLNLEANLDQGARAFRQDMVATLLDKGVIAVVPVDTSIDPNTTGGYNIHTMRVGEVVSWYPKHVLVSLYNEKIGRREELLLPKEIVAIIENPLYAVMNEPNSTLQRLIRKLNLLDAIDEQMGSGRLDIIIQLPYVVKNETRQEQAEKRRRDIEMQLKDSKYGVAYTDGTERITQLNRAAENNMLSHVEWLTNMLYGQLGMTEEVFNGTADEKVMLNYYNRTIEPILAAITEGLKRKFLTKTAISQRQSIEYFRNPFTLVSVSSMAEISDKLTRNEIASANEIRSILGWMPSTDPRADQLRNSNLPEPDSPPIELEPVGDQLVKEIEQ